MTYFPTKPQPNKPLAPTRVTLLLVGLLLLFLLLAWAVWWYFEWQIQALDRLALP